MNINKQIPIFPKVGGWKDVPIVNSRHGRSPLVPIGLFTKYSRYFFTDPIYSGLMSSSPYKYGELNGLVGTYVLELIAEMLVSASKKLLPRQMFLVWDAYRPQYVQKSLFDFYIQKLVYTRGGKSEDYYNEAQKYVSIPSVDPNKPSPHSTGAVVDLTIIEFTQEGWDRLQTLNLMLKKKLDEKDLFKVEMERFKIMREQSFPIEMGTMFDDMRPEAGLYFYEDNQPKNYTELLAKNNRRYLFNVLNSVGFTGYEEEWWHFSFGDQFWGKKTYRDAIFSMAFFTNECSEYENMICGVMDGMSKIADGALSGNKLQQAKHILYDFVRMIALENGDIRKNVHPVAIPLQ